MKFRYLMYLLPVLFFLANTGNSYAATIDGKTPVCLNDTANYWIDAPTTGLVYLWGVSSHGTAGSTTVSPFNVQWTSAGTGTVSAYGVDGSGDTIELLTYAVTINLAHKPHLTTNYRVACQELAGEMTNQQQPAGILDTSKCMLVCSGATVTYYAHGLGGSTYTWTASGHSDIFPMGDSCIVIWGSPGRGTLTCTETTTLGCSDDITYCFEIIEKPLAHFETFAVYTDNDNSTNNSFSICLNDLVIFKDLSTATPTAPIMSCYWDFGDGKFTTTGSPTSTSHKYTVPGSYTAMLVVRNACGCTDTARVQIDVKPEEGQYITCPAVVCEGTIAGYRVHNYGSCSPFHWIVQGGTILPSGPPSDTVTVRWDNVDSTGFGYVMFDGSSCSAPCNGSAIVKVPVIQNKGKINGPRVICVGQPAMYRMPQWPTTMFYWNTATAGVTLDTTDQWNEIVVTATTPGTLILRVNYHNTLLGCGGVAYDTITVIDTATIIGPTRYCVGLSTTWTLSTAGLLGDWVLIRPDGSTSTLSSSNSFNTTLLTAGNYKLAVEGNFCGIDTLRFKVNPKAPAVDYLNGPDKACEGIPTTYEAGNLLSSTRNFHWAADLGTVSPGITATNAITFSGSGPWEVKVWRTDILTGCPSDTLRKTVTNTVAPVTLSGPSPVCGSSRHTYEVDYLDGETYDWGIIATSDGTNYIGTVSKTKDSSEVEITWNNPHGTSELAKVWIRIRRCGVDMSDTLDVLVEGAPVLVVSGPASICSGVEATFTFTATPAITSATSYTWSFGDGKTESTSTPTVHTYNTYGSGITRNFKVVLSIAGANGCYATVTGGTSIDVDPQPVLILGDVGGSSLNHCDSPLAWVNTLGLLAGSSTVSTYNWTKVPSAPSLGTGATLPVTTTLWGTGAYVLEATNTFGCISRDTVSISDSCGCDSTTRPTLTVSGSLTSCAHISATGSWTPAGWGFDPSWSWKGSGTKGVSTTGTTFEADYDSAGVKRIIYKVKYLAGADTCIATDSVDVIVPYVPYLLAEFSCNSGGTGHKLTLTDVSSVFTGTYTYTFLVNGSPELITTTPNSSVDVTTILTPGTTYIVELVITGGAVPCTVGHSVTVPFMPVASFTIPKYNPACINAVVELTNTSPGTEPDWRAHWFYGDGSDNNLWSPWKEYENPSASADDYTVTLIIRDRYGCSDTAKDTVVVVPDNLSGNILVPGGTCAGSTVLLDFASTGTSTPIEYTWYEQTEMLATTSTTPYAVYKSGGYWVFVKDAFGCVEKTSMEPVTLSTPPEASIAGPSEVCDGDSYTLTCPAAEFFVGTAFYQWEINGVWGTPGTIPELIESKSPGTYTYRLVTRVGLICTDTSAVHTVVVHPKPAKPTISVAMLDCDEYKVELSASSSSAGVFNWSSGDVGTPVIVYEGGPYRVWITDANGCIDYEDVYVEKDPAVYQYIFPTGCYNLCLNEAPFTLMGPRPPATFAKWDWLRGGVSHIGGTGFVDPYLVNSPDVYNLALDNGYCADTSGDMDVSFKDCGSGGCFGSVEFTGHFQTLAPPLCFDSLRFNIVCPPGTTWTILADKGTLLPAIGSGTAMAKKFRYIALPGFTPPEFITVIFTNPTTGVTCRVRIPINFVPAPCDNSLARYNLNPTVEEQGNELAQLLLLPNPASSTVQIEYSFTSNGKERSVELFDMTGRRIWERSVEQHTGSIRIALDEYSSGLYQVILRQDGKVLLHSKLSVVK